MKKIRKQYTKNGSVYQSEKKKKKAAATVKETMKKTEK